MRTTKSGWKREIWNPRNREIRKREVGPKGPFSPFFAGFNPYAHAYLYKGYALWYIMRRLQPSPKQAIAFAKKMREKRKKEGGESPSLRLFNPCKISQRHIRR